MNSKKISRYEIISESADYPMDTMVTQVSKETFFKTVMNVADNSYQDEKHTIFYKNHKAIGVVWND